MYARQLEAGLPTVDLEKLALTTPYSPRPADSAPQRDHRRKMPSPRPLVFIMLALALVMLGVVSAVPPQQSGNNGPCDRQDGEQLQVQPGAGNDDAAGFPCLLNAVSSEALHDVLHKYFPTRFKDGIYESDKNAMEAIHKEDAPLATSLVRIARRQGGGSNATTSTTSSTAKLSSTKSTTQVVPTTPQTTPPAEKTTLTASTTLAPAPTSTTSSKEITPPSTTPPDPTPTTPRSRRPVTSTFTSTASNGGLVVVTQTSYVDADPGQPTSTSGAGGSLQTNAAAAPLPRNLAAEAFAGMVLGGMMLI